MIKLEIREFIGSYSHLNTTLKNHKVSLFDIARAYMTIGYPRLIPAISNFGIFRFCEIYLRVINNLERAGSFYRLKSHFKSIDPSEQKTISYFLGQSLTKLFAEDFLNCKIVFNTNDFKSSLTTQSSISGFIPKRELTEKWNKTPKEPDLIGITKQGEYHVLEAKGSSSKYSLTAHQHAINQVSIISKINGKDPETKSACYYKLFESQIGGLIIDPESDLKSINISFKNDEIIRKYYSIFNLQYLKRNKIWKLTAGTYSFALFRIPFPYYPYIYYGVDMDIFNAVNQRGLIELKDYPKNLEFKNRSVKKYSLGKDGTILISLTRPTNLETELYET